VAGACGRFELDLFTHDVLLSGRFWD